ncbi:putative 3-ketoacyl-acyl carrier protein reductase, fabG [Chlamydiales bacterium STE3]|nr:putative 3-ketoacyl-acyl carrier protein reductase, fabG [Chlamydiales bacterium STE3]
MKWTLVTGGAKGLGRNTALTLAKLGHSVVIQYRHHAAEAEEVIKQCRIYGVNAEAVCTNFRTFLDIESFIQVVLERFPEIQHLVNNVGSYSIGSALTTPLDKWEEIFMTNLHLPFLLSKAFSPSIIRNEGTITMIGVAGLQNLRADTYASAYASAKTALLQLTRTLAKELIAHQVRVNMVSPGYLENAIDLPSDLSKIPLGKPTTLEEVSQMIAFLMDDKNRSITGQNIEIAGGIRL